MVLWLHGPEVAKKLLSLEAEEAFQQKDECMCVILMLPFPEKLLVDYGGSRILHKVDPLIEPIISAYVLPYTILFSLKCFWVCDTCHVPLRMGSCWKKWR